MGLITAACGSVRTDGSCGVITAIGFYILGFGFGFSLFGLFSFCRGVFLRFFLFCPKTKILSLEGKGARGGGEVWFVRLLEERVLGEGEGKPDIK